MPPVKAQSSPPGNPHEPADEAAARQELEKLRAQCLHVGRWFYAFVSFLFAAGFAYLAIRDGTPHPSAVWFSVLLLATWGLVVAAGIVPQKAPERHWRAGYERIAYLEGYLAAQSNRPASS